ncbi:hypothetical protein ACIBEF_29785 [Micromonospora sp. NPDC050795]|uniref:hypothetical protein n=1 Tax=Micromonospora sp. NPDC050795 TaxID=3364282 RepID=UPI00379B9CB4
MVRRPVPGGANRDQPRVAQHRPDDGHALVGLVAVRRARPGQTLAVRVDAVIPANWGTTMAGGWPIGLKERYGVQDQQVFTALDSMLTLMQRLHGLTRPDAVALASIAVDVRVTQIVNQSVGAHAVLRDDALRWPDAGSVGGRR